MVEVALAAFFIIGLLQFIWFLFYGIKGIWNTYWFLERTWFELIRFQPDGEPEPRARSAAAEAFPVQSSDESQPEEEPLDLAIMDADIQEWP